MTHKMFKINALIELKNALFNDLDLYIDSFNNGDKVIDRILPTNTYSIDIFDISFNLPKLNSDNTWEAGFENSKLIYEGLGEQDFPLKYSMDEKFWSHLCFTKYWKYMINRYPMTTNNNKGRLASRYFFGKNPERRHELARLYWIPYLTIQDDVKDKYELTKIAFEYADPSSQIIERNIGRNPVVVRASLKAIKNNSGHKKIKDRNITARFAKRVNNIAGFLIIDYIDEDKLTIDFSKILSEELNK